MLRQELNAATMRFTERKVTEWERMNNAELKAKHGGFMLRKHGLRTYFCVMYPLSFSSCQSTNQKFCARFETEENPHPLTAETADANTYTALTH